MKRPSRKKRALQYIRTKNDIVSGERCFYSTLKLSSELLEDLEFIEDLLKKQCKAANESLLKIYKISLDIMSWRMYPVDDDLVKNLVTI